MFSVLVQVNFTGHTTVLRILPLTSWVDKPGGGGCCFRQFVSGLVTLHVFMVWNPDEDGGDLAGVLSLANGLGVVCAALNS